MGLLLSLIFSSAGGALLGVTTKVVRHFAKGSKEKKDNKKLQKIIELQALHPAVDVPKIIKALNQEDPQFKPQIKKVSKDKIRYLFGKQFGKSYETVKENNAFNPKSAVRWLVSKRLTFTMCAITVYWAIAPDVTLFVIPAMVMEDTEANGLFNKIGRFFYEFTPDPEKTVEISTKSLVFTMMNVYTFLIHYYFTSK